MCPPENVLYLYDFVEEDGCIEKEHCLNHPLESLSRSSACSSAEAAEAQHLLGCVVQSLSPVQIFVTPQTAACQTSLSFTIPKLAQTHVH